MAWLSPIILVYFLLQLYVNPVTLTQYMVLEGQ